MTMLARAQRASRGGRAQYARYQKNGSEPKTALTHEIAGRGTPRKVKIIAGARVLPMFQLALSRLADAQAQQLAHTTTRAPCLGAWLL